MNADDIHRAHTPERPQRCRKAKTKGLRRLSSQRYKLSHGGQVLAQISMSSCKKYKCSETIATTKYRRF